MGNFQGYYVKFGTVKMPNRYTATVTETPNQRAEISAERDDYTQELVRVTSPFTKTKIEYTTIDGMDEDDMLAIKNVMANGLLNSLQRKYSCTYWNSESQTYVSGIFYCPDITYEYSQIDEKTNKIYYKSVRFALIEY